MVGCGPKELSKADAERIIRKELQFPRVKEFSIFRTELDQARIVLNSNLDEEGLLTVSQDISNPMIEFTEKAKPYLLPTSEADEAMQVQKVKLADEDLVEVTGIKTSEDGKTAVVEFTTALTNLTPFADLLPHKVKESTNAHEAYFTLYDDGWRLEKRED
jgi:hypothetical protein